MNITTDVEDINQREGSTMHTQEEALQGIKKVFAELLEDLRPEIEKEESEQPCHIMIHILPPMEQWNLPADNQDQGLRLTLKGYSEDLSIKIQQAVAAVMDASAGH